jgi:SAM-dependent methyltransferase
METNSACPEGVVVATREHKMRIEKHQEVDMMRRTIAGLGAALLLSCGGALAQMGTEAPPEHKMHDKGVGDHATGGHHMSGHAGHGDGAFHHRFDDAEKWAKQFDKPERDAWQKPEQVIDALKLPGDALVADIGAGTGYFTARIARRVPKGAVFAVDVEPDMVRYLGERAKRENLANVKPVLATADSANLPEPVDVILLVDAYHHIGNRVDYFGKLRSALKPGGRLALVDFRMDSPEGPPKEHRVSVEQATQELSAAGFTLVEKHDLLPRQYFAVFQKSDK